MNKNIIHQRTIKVKLKLSSEQQNDISESFSDAKIVFDLFSKLACKHKSTSYMTLHKYGYNTAKELCPNMPTAYIQAIAKNACIAVKSWNANNKKKKWLYKGKKKSTTIPLNKLTFSRRGNLTTISTNNKRIRIEHEIPQWFIERYPVTNKNIQAGFIYIANNIYWLCIVYKIESIKKIKKRNRIGVDRGLYNFVTLSDGTIISSKAAIAVKRKYQYKQVEITAKRHSFSEEKIKETFWKRKAVHVGFQPCSFKAISK